MAPLTVLTLTLACAATAIGQDSVSECAANSDGTCQSQLEDSMRVELLQERYSMGGSAIATAPAQKAAVKDIPATATKANTDAINNTLTKSTIAKPLQPEAQKPLVSAMLTTCNRPAFVKLALRQIARQDYPNIEVVLIDDGSPSIEETLRPEFNISSSGLTFAHVPVTILRSATRMSIGAKRNMGITAARGSIVIHWDDDDLYPPNRVSAQVQPILSGEAPISALELNIIGSLAYKKELIHQMGGFADVSLAEDLHFVDKALSTCHWVHVVPGVDLVYTRHQSRVSNTWFWSQETFSDLMGENFSQIAPPAWVTSDILGEYVKASYDTGSAGSCSAVTSREPVYKGNSKQFLMYSPGIVGMWATENSGRTGQMWTGPEAFPYMPEHCCNADHPSESWRCKKLDWWRETPSESWLSTGAETTAYSGAYGMAAAYDLARGSAYGMAAAYGMERAHAMAQDDGDSSKVVTTRGPVQRELPLEELMYLYGTDKSKDDHKYSDLYAMLFEPIRHNVRNVTEIGVKTGQSHKVWHEFFRNASIYGIDVFSGWADMPTALDRLKLFERCRIFKASSTDQSAVALLGWTAGSMDIIVDDGAHDIDSQEKTLILMWPFVRPGGYYIIEDVEWDKEANGDIRAYPFLHYPERLKPEARAILEGNDAFFADTSLGQRNWNSFHQLEGPEWNRDRFSHNSHVVVIRKRTQPLHDVQMNEGWTAMK